MHAVATIPAKALLSAPQRRPPDRETWAVRRQPHPQGPQHPNSLQGRHSPPSPHNRTNLRSPTARTSLTNQDNPTAHRRATTGPAETTVPATIPGRRSKAITGLAAIRDSEARAPNAPATVRPLLRPRALIRARCVPTCHRLTHGTALLHLPDGVFPVRGVRSARYWASHSAPP